MCREISLQKKRKSEGKNTHQPTRAPTTIGLPLDLLWLVCRHMCFLFFVRKIDSLISFGFLGTSFLLVSCFIHVKHEIFACVQHGIFMQNILHHHLNSYLFRQHCPNTSSVLMCVWARTHLHVSKFVLQLNRIITNTLRCTANLIVLDQRPHFHLNGSLHLKHPSSKVTNTVICFGFWITPGDRLTSLLTGQTDRLAENKDACKGYLILPCGARWQGAAARWADRLTNIQAHTCIGKIAHRFMRTCFP